MRITSILLVQRRTRTVDHLVLAGHNTLVGFAIAEGLVKRFPGRQTLVLGSERSSGSSKEEGGLRGEGIVHAGIYYPPTSLKTRFSLRGRQLLAIYCKTHSVPYSEPGQLIFSSKKDKQSILRVGELYMHTESLGPSSEAWLLMGAELGEMERQLDGSQVATALYVPQMGVVDLPALQASLLGRVEQGGGVWAGGREVKGVRRADGEEAGWVVRTSLSGAKAEEAEEEEIRATQLILADPQSLPPSIFDPPLINPAGPSSSSSAGRTPRYFAYTGPGVEGVEKLMYPCPAEGMGQKELGGPNLVHIGEDGKVVFEVWGDGEMGVEDVAERVRDYLPNVVASSFSLLPPPPPPPPPPHQSIPASTDLATPQISHSVTSHPNLLAIHGFPTSSRATVASALAIGEGVSRFLVQQDPTGSATSAPDDGALDSEGREWWDVDWASQSVETGPKPWWKVW